MIAAEGFEMAIVRDRLEALLVGERLGRPLEIHASIASTNDRARELGRRGAADGCMVIAERQEAGRGRRGRRWESAPGGLYVSWLLRPPRRDQRYAAGLQLAAGVAVAETVGGLTGVLPTLLWPNDCLSGHAKLAGVLVEAESGAAGLDFLVCGIGVNVNQDAGDFPAELRGVAASLRTLSGKEFGLEEVAAELVRTLGPLEEAVRESGPEAVTARWQELSPTAQDHDVELETVEGPVRGRSAGLGPLGGLRVECATATREITLGELIRVRRPR